jgi:uncharacterized surface protein with fasciclin (FAS1) repeats
MKMPIVLLGLISFALVGCSNENPLSPSSESSDPNLIQAGGEVIDPSTLEGADGPDTEITVESRAVAAAPDKDIVDTAISAGFSTLVAAVQAADLEGALRSDGPFTVFAPTNEAFGNLPAGLVDKLLLPENKEKLQEILLYHVLAGEVASGDLRYYQQVETLEGDKVRIIKWWRKIWVNNARVTTANVFATNGVIHVINKVLIPPGFTLEDPPAPTKDIVDTAVSAGFSTLVSAVQAAGLEGALRGDGPLTVFAPTNDAFSNLPDGLVDELLLPENKDKLQQLLTYHVLAGQVLSSDLRPFQGVNALSGERLWITKSFRGVVRVNIFSKVEPADVLATNGVIHVINRVLIPPSFYGQFASLPLEDKPEI